MLRWMAQFKTDFVPYRDTLGVEVDGTVQSASIKKHTENDCGKRDLGDWIGGKCCAYVATMDYRV